MSCALAQLLLATERVSTPMNCRTCSCPKSLKTLIEDGTDEVRSLTAEENGPDGRAVIRSAAWFDPDYERTRYDDEG